MQVLIRFFYFVVCVVIAMPAIADDIVAEVEQELPYHEVAPSYGSAMIAEGRCLAGTPFWMERDASGIGAGKDVAQRIHEKIRELHANAFVLVDSPENTRTRRIKVVPLTCDLR